MKLTNILLGGILAAIVASLFRKQDTPVVNVTVPDPSGPHTTSYGPIAPQRPYEVTRSGLLSASGCINDDTQNTVNPSASRGRGFSLVGRV